MSGMSHLLRWSMFGPVLGFKTPTEGRVSPDPDNFIPFNRHDVMMSCGLHLKQVWCYPISMPPMHDYWMRNIHCRCIVLGNEYEKDLCRPELSVIGLSWLLLCMFLRRWGQQHWTWHSLQRCGQFWTTRWTCWFLLPPWKTTKHWNKLKLLPWDDLISRWYILSTVLYAAWEDIRLPQHYSLPFSCRLKDSSSRMQVGSLDCGCNAKLNDSLSRFLLAVFKRDLPSVHCEIECKHRMNQPASSSCDSSLPMPSKWKGEVPSLETFIRKWIKLPERFSGQVLPRCRLEGTQLRVTNW